MEFALGLMDLDMCILEDKPIASSDERLSDIKSRLEKWERSNRISLMIIQRSISETICGAFSSYDTVKEFLDAIGQKFKESDEVEITNLLTSFSNTQYDNTEGVKNYILKIVHIATR